MSEVDMLNAGMSLKDEVEEKYSNLKRSYLLYNDLEKKMFDNIYSLDFIYFLEYVKRTEKNDKLVTAFQDIILECQEITRIHDAGWINLPLKEWLNELFDKRDKIIKKIHHMEQGIKLHAAIQNKQKSEQAPEITNILFLDLLREDSPGTYKAIMKLIESKRVEITQDTKLNFQCFNKGTVAHIFKEGGYTEWNRVTQYILIDGQIITGSLKTLAGNEPPKEFEKVKKEIYQK
jgi:hypothetical protein